MNDVEKKRLVKEMYRSDKWSDRVDHMSSQQIHRIFETARKPGGRLDPDIRYRLVKNTLDPELKEKIGKAPAWMIYEMNLEALRKEEPYHQMTLFEYGLCDG